MLTSRSKFIQIFCIISLFCCLKEIKGQSQNQYDVIVIGGGIGGTTAANKLIGYQHSVILLQAESQIGGRMKTTNVTVGSSSVFKFDEGASWIHGYSDDNPLKELSESVSGVSMVETIDDRTQVYDQSGNSIDSQVNSAQSQFSNAVSSANGYGTDVSMESAFSSISNNYLSDKYFMYHVGTNLQFQTSGTINLMSAVWNDESFDGSEMLITSGYQNFVKTLAQQVSLQVLTGHKVTKVTYNEQQNMNTVECENGVSIKGKYVLIAVPLGVLKAQSIQFSPSLTDSKIKAIQSLGFGNVCKILVSFTTIDFLSTSSHYIGVASTDVTERGLISYFLNLKAVANIPALMTFGLGPNADEIQQMSEADLKNLIATKINLFASRTVLTSQFSITRSSWRTNENIKGAYSFATTTTTDSIWSAMAQPITDYHWYFCGQHTYSQYRGTVHGAHLSGIKAAYDINLHIHIPLIVGLTVGLGVPLLAGIIGFTVYKVKKNKEEEKKNNTQLSQDKNMQQTKGQFDNV